MQQKESKLSLIRYGIDFRTTKIQISGERAFCTEIGAQTSRGLELAPRTTWALTYDRKQRVKVWDHQSNLSCREGARFQVPHEVNSGS
jgi:hypothetical protein